MPPMHYGHMKSLPMNQNDLAAKKSRLSHSAFSQHLAILREAGLIKTRRVAKTLYYSIQNESVLQILATLKDIFCPEVANKIKE